MSNNNMTKCNCCRDPILDEQDLHFLNLHEVCFLEREKRLAHGKCELCGKNDKKENSNVCSKCLANNADYEGYKGPGK